MPLHKRSQRLSDPKAEKPLKLDSPLQDRPGPEAAEDGEGDQVAAGHRDAGAAPGDRGRGSHVCSASKSSIRRFVLLVESGYYRFHI